MIGRLLFGVLFLAALLLAPPLPVDAHHTDPAVAAVPSEVRAVKVGTFTRVLYTDGVTVLFDRWDREVRSYPAPNEDQPGWDCRRHGGRRCAPGMAQALTVCDGHFHGRRARQARLACWEGVYALSATLAATR